MKRDMLKRYRKQGFTLSIWDTHRTDNMGKSILGYRLSDRSELIFTGEDFKASPLHAVDSLHVVAALLNFLSLKQGDTDKEYFEDYTPEQLEWSQSFRCEELGMIAFELQERLDKRLR